METIELRVGEAVHPTLIAGRAEDPGPCVLDALADLLCYTGARREPVWITVTA